MNITSIQTTSWQSLLAGFYRQDGGSDSSAAEAAVTPETAVQQKNLVPSSANLMSGNFAGSRKGPSKYVSAVIQAKKAEAKVMSEMEALVGSMSVCLYLPSGKRNAMVEASIGAVRTKKLMKRYENQKVVKEAEKTHLADSRKLLEEKAAEAMAPKDAEGNPLRMPGNSGEDSIRPESQPQDQHSLHQPLPQTADPDLERSLPELSAASVTAPGPASDHHAYETSSPSPTRVRKYV